MRSSLALALAALLFSAAPAAAQTAPPKPDFAPMTFFAGLWNCKHLKHPDPKQAGGSFSFYGHTDPSGYWEIFEFANGELNITLDSVTKKWVFVYLGNGGDYGLLTSDGWQGNTLTLHDVVNAAAAPLGEGQITKTGDSQYRAVYTARTPSGVETYENVCTRV
jgi:hypothetical protein